MVAGPCFQIEILMLQYVYRQLRHIRFTCENQIYEDDHMRADHKTGITWESFAVNNIILMIGYS